MKTASKLPVSFTRKETTGILTLLTIIALLYTGAHFIPLLIQPPAPVNGADSTWLLAAAATRKEGDPEDSLSYPKDNLFNQSSAQNYFSPVNRILFPFDPNTLPAEGWQKLGIKPKTIRTIMNYRNKGGRFRTKEDLQKIYGLSPADYTALLPYVQMPSPKKRLSPLRLIRNSPWPAGPPIPPKHTMPLILTSPIRPPLLPYPEWAAPLPNVCSISGKNSAGFTV